MNPPWPPLVESVHKETQSKGQHANATNRVKIVRNCWENAWGRGMRENQPRLMRMEAQVLLPVSPQSCWLPFIPRLQSNVLPSPIETFHP